MKGRGTPSVPAVERVLTVLELLSESRNGLAISDLVNETGWPKSSLHCLLLTLERRGYLYRNESTGRYMFGVRLLFLAERSLGTLRLRQQAHPFLHALMTHTGLTSHFGVLAENEVVVVSKVEPHAGCRLATWVSKRMDLHCTGLGKALMAAMPDDQVERLVRERGLPCHNENTIVSLRKLQQDLEAIRLRGYAVDDEEDEIGLRCVGAVVLDASGAATAAISVSGTIEQITGRNLGSLGEAVKHNAGALSQALQGRSMASAAAV
ncbi:MAG: IclR family transcriptional regulator [Bryobacterales bacterium]|nr:IclR family transcriptional regulator [Bryobacterales bacterium]